MRDIISHNSIRGRVRPHVVFAHPLLTSASAKTVFGTESPWYGSPISDWKSNLVTYEWAAIVTKLLGLGDVRYRIGGMYLEFENVAAPGDPVSVPSLDRTRDVDYYDSLVDSGVRDYIRVPMTAHTIATVGDDYHDNVITFFARSQGLQGVHGKAFDAGSNSVIFGGSLVAFVDDTDATQDLILSSFYFEVEDQQPKLSTSQVGLEWELTLQ